MKMYKTKLEEEKNLLEEELKTLGKVSSTGDWEATPDSELGNQEVQDEADMGEKTADYEERSIKLNALELRLSDIKRALEKIEKDNYGVCENCEIKIEEDRLEANPAARTCKECMNKVI